MCISMSKLTTWIAANGESAQTWTWISLVGDLDITSQITRMKTYTYKLQLNILTYEKHWSDLFTIAVYIKCVTCLAWWRDIGNVVRDT